MLNYLLLCLLAHSAYGSENKPNFVIILTDDQDVVLGGMTPMKNVQRFIANEGITFTKSYTTSPICCPSRASLLTGKYVHNHQTTNNSISGGCYGSSWLEHEQRTFATALNNNGYHTFYAGKYMNQYGVKEAGGPEVVPPGWSEWHGLVGNSVYYDYTISNNGVPTRSTDLYLTDVIRDLAISYIENQTETTPFLMVLAPPAPHQPWTPAPRHRGLYSNVTAMRNPNFNNGFEKKHWLIQMPPTPLPDSMLPELDEAYRLRWESLLAVDEMVADVVNALDTQSLLHNTYLIYTSDNGYHIGQFAQVFDKRQPYEADIKVPLLIRGPGVPKNVENNQPVLNIDIAPTILNLAGFKTSRNMDGHAIDVSAEATSAKERNMLIEYYGEGGRVNPNCTSVIDDGDLTQCRPEYSCKCQDARNNTYACLRHIAHWIDFKYCMFRDNDHFSEVYDLLDDPHELSNIADNLLPAVRHWYQLTLNQMLHCEGTSCETISS